ncbi:MAG TPA: 50S ribosomal protein L21 [Candidatus Gracilibacteria bacterium]|nr:50S ribosomal protein L21 [Candidatus Gracilibacteria bacterium]
MLAIFEHGGKQYKVTLGTRVELPTLEANPGEIVTFKEVLLLSDGAQIEVGTPFIHTLIKAEVIEHGRGDKIRVVKQKSKKRYHKVQGHRQDYTLVKIVKIADAELTTTVSAEKKPRAKKVEA